MKRLRKPWVELVWLPLTYKLGKVLGELNRFSQFGMLCHELHELFVAWFPQLLSLQHQMCSF